MKNTKATGLYGERLAEYILLQWDFQILEKNWRFSKSEIDIIAEKDNILHFIEVKLRSNIQFGFPEESVNEEKLNRIQTAAEAYLKTHVHWSFISIDIMAIVLNPSGYDYKFFEDIS